MSRFYAEIQGSRGAATRQGSKKSGISGHIRSWNLGAYVVCYVGQDGKDHIRVSITGGSNDPSIKKVLIDISEDEVSELKGL